MFKSFQFYILLNFFPESDVQDLRSSTLKSNFTDYDTPPETPELKSARWDNKQFLHLKMKAISFLHKILINDTPNTPS